MNERIADLAEILRKSHPRQLDYEADQTYCPICGLELRCYKTKFKDVIDVNLGRFEAREILKVCTKHKYMVIDSKKHVSSFGSSELARLVASGSRHSYDLMVNVGLWRFQKCRQIREIEEELIDEYGLHIPRSQISALAERFLLYVRCVHEQSVDLLRQEMENQGGWVLHIDSSAEGKELVFVGLGAFQGNQVVLFSQRVTTERGDRLSEVLMQAKETFGEPLCIVRDMGVGGQDAATYVFNGVPQRVCHWHWLADVGSDMLKRLHDELRGLIRGAKIRKHFQGLRNNLSKELVLGATKVRNYEAFLNEKVRTPGELLWALATWVLDYRSAGEGLSFPFDLPYWYLYQRIAQAQKAVRDIARAECDPKMKRLISRFQDRLDKMFGDDDMRNRFKVLTGEMEKLIGLFQRLRKILRLERKLTEELLPSLTLREEVIESKQELEKFYKEAKKGTRNKKYGSELQRAYKIIVDHLDKHGEYLFLPELDNTGKPFPQWAILDRTNNIEESFFGRFKTGIRRATGKKSLSQEFAAHGEDRALVENLKSPVYIRVIYGSLSNLSSCFAKVPVERIREAARNMKSRKQGPEHLPKRIHIELDDLLASIDRTVEASAINSELPSNITNSIEAAMI